MSRPKIHASDARRLPVTLPREVHEAAQLAALRDRRSMNSLVVVAVEEYLERLRPREAAPLTRPTDI